MEEWRGKGTLEMKRDYVICGGLRDKGGYRKGRTLGKEKVGNDPDSLTLIASSPFRFFQMPFFSNVRWKDGSSAKTSSVPASQYQTT